MISTRGLANLSAKRFAARLTGLPLFQAMPAPPMGYMVGLISAKGNKIK
jgi:hypothetical protein